MSNRPKRGLAARLAVSFTVLAFPLLTAGVAQAALAGATPAQFSVPPNLRSATINSTYSNVVEVCFDKTINGAAFFNTGFKLAGYRAGNTITSLSASVDQNNTNCAVVLFPTTIADENQYTILEISPTTVLANATTTPNLADSVALTGSTSHSGTTGVSTQPNLVGVLVPDSTHLATDSLTFVFDKTTHVVSALAFNFISAAGADCLGQVILGGNDSTAVTISFSSTAGPTSTDCVAGLGNANVGQAVRAGPVSGGVYADQDPIPSAPYTAPTQVVPLPNCASPCATSHPDLTSAALASNQDQIVFTFDKNVVVGNPLAFFAELTNGNIIRSTGATLTAPNQITATFSGNLSNKAEYAIYAWINSGGAYASDDLTVNGVSLPGTATIGDNAGAFASGFTTAPDSFGISINHTNGQVIVNLDDRVSAVAANLAHLVPYTAQGLPIGITPTSVSYNSSAGPGPVAVTLQYSPSGITNMTALQMLQGAFTGPCPAGGPCTTPFSTVLADSQNVPQIDDPPNDAAILQAAKAIQAKHQRRHHRHLTHQEHHR